MAIINQTPHSTNYTKLALYMITTAKIIYAFYWKVHTVPSAEEWIIKLWEYTSKFKIAFHFKTKSDTHTHTKLTEIGNHFGI